MCRVHLVVSKSLGEDVNRKESHRQNPGNNNLKSVYTEVEGLTRETEKWREQWEETQESLGQGRSFERPVVKPSKSC